MHKTLQIIDFTLRLVVLTMTLTVGTMFLLASAAHAATLKPVSAVNSETLRAGDVFDGLTKEQADFELGTTPVAGKDLVLDSRTLSRIAETIDLNWKPSSAADQVIVRRAATIVNEGEIRDALNKGLKDQGIDGKFKVVFADNASPMMSMPPNQAETVAVKDLRFNPQKDWFEATMAAPDADHPQTQITLTGRIQRLTSIPMMINSLRHGDLISADDITMVDMASEDVQPGMLLKPEQLIGMTPQRLVYAGKPVQQNDVERPRVVSRGDMITLLYTSGPLVLTTKGKAMQDGAQGDMVRVVNISSARTLQGVASGDHEVTVTE